MLRAEEAEGSADLKFYIQRGPGFPQTVSKTVTVTVASLSSACGCLSKGRTRRLIKEAAWYRLWEGERLVYFAFCRVVMLTCLCDQGTTQICPLVPWDEAQVITLYFYSLNWTDLD